MFAGRCGGEVTRSRKTFNAAVPQARHPVLHGCDHHILSENAVRFRRQSDRNSINGKTCQVDMAYL